MNETESKARVWLEQQGYHVIFQHRKSPDFLTEQGLGFEVKKVRGNTLVFSIIQWQQLKQYPKLKILVFNEGEIPEAIIPFQELDTPPSYWQKYRLVLVDFSALSIKISPETKKKLDELRHPGQTYDESIRELIENVEKKEK